MEVVRSLLHHRPGLVDVTLPVRRYAVRPRRAFLLKYGSAAGR
jgi:hypothetical protein